MKKIIFVAAVIATTVFIINIQDSTIEYQGISATSSPIVVTREDPLVEAQRQLKEATDKLNAREAEIKAEREVAISTAATKIADLMREIEQVESERDATSSTLDERLDEINKIRAESF